MKTVKIEVRLCLIDLRLTSTNNGFSITELFDEWTSYLAYITTAPEEVIITGDLNFQFAVPTKPNILWTS